METPATYQNLLKIIIWENDLLVKLFGENKKYSPLLNRLSRYTSESEEPYPKQKELLNELGLVRSEIIKLMGDLVSEFYESIRFDYPILKTEVVFVVDTFDGSYFSTTIQNLQYLPRINETVSFPFFRTEYGSVMHLKVISIDHTIENQKHIITLFTKHVKKK